MEFVSEFDLTSQQINDISDYINSPVNVTGCDYVPFEGIEYPVLDATDNEYSTTSDAPQHQLQIIKNRNGIRYMKFKKSKKNVKPKLIDTQQPQQCPVDRCRAILPSRMKLRKHIQEHAFRKHHRCDICFEEFNVLENLTLHISLHSADGRCPQCGKIFRRLASLEGHIKTHFKNEYFTCNQGCDEMFHSEWMLREHVNRFHPSENAKAQQEREELAKERRQKRRSLLNCKHCGKQFTKNCLLIRHERIHNGQKPFKCDRCDRCFAQKNTLVIHQRRHSDQRMFQCTQCPQSFVQKGNLLSHLAKCHSYKEGEPSFPCNQCSCAFKKIGTLNAHISKFHASHGIQMEDDLGFKVDDVMQQLNDLHRSGSSLDSELISKELFFNLPTPTTDEVNIENVTPHLQSDHSRSATQSSLKLAVHTNNGIVTHRNVMQRIHGNVRWYVCLYCPKECRRPSDLIRHIRIHTKEKPFACPLPTCTKAFSVKSSLNTHLNTHLKLSQQQTCRVCLQTFTSTETFDEHCWLSHQDSPMFQCFICSQLCVTNGELKRHIKCHRSPVKVKKTTPPEDTDDGIQLDIIMKEPIMLTNDGQIEITTEKSVFDQERKFECTMCSSSFKRKGHLKEHMLSHTGVKLHKCDICSKSFGKMSILNRHLLYHSNEKKYKCNMCSASFISNNQLNRHSLKHTNQRNVMCPYCQKRFKSKATCRIHLQIHKNEWVKQFKEKLKSGTIQFEEDPTNQPVLDMMTSSTNEGIVETIQNVPESDQILFTDLVQNDDSRNQFEYFLLLPTGSEPIGIGADGRPENEQFVVDDEQLNFANLQFIQLEQSQLLEMQNTQSTPLITSYQVNADNSSVDSNADSLQVVPALGSVEAATHNVESTEQQSDQVAKQNEKLQKTRVRKSTKSINKCETCGKVFQKPIDLRRHIRTHTLEKPFSCTICPKAFSLKSTLQNHINHKHLANKKMHPCTVCWKEFSSRHAVITHTLIHSNLRPFKCEYCTTTFRTRGHLKIHQQIHLRESRKLGVNPSEIKTKKEKAKLLQILNVMKDLSDQTVYEGIVDEYTEIIRVERSDNVTTNGTIDNLDSLVNVTSDCYQCSTCPEQFNNKDSLKAHAATHKENLQCPDCHKAFKKPSLLKRHRIVHVGSKEFTCKVCQKSYTQKTTLQAHMGLHTDGACFECSQCHKKFNFKTNLTTHKRQCNAMLNSEPLDAIIPSI